MKHYSHRTLLPFWGKVIVTSLIIIMNIGICAAQSAGLKIHYLGANHSFGAGAGTAEVSFAAGGRGCSRSYRQCIGEQ